MKKNHEIYAELAYKSTFSGLNETSSLQFEGDVEIVDRLGELKSLFLTRPFTISKARIDAVGAKKKLNDKRLAEIMEEINSMEERYGVYFSTDAYKKYKELKGDLRVAEFQKVVCQYHLGLAEDEKSYNAKQSAIVSRSLLRDLGFIRFSKFNEGKQTIELFSSTMPKEDLLKLIDEIYRKEESDQQRAVNAIYIEFGYTPKEPPKTEVEAVYQRFTDDQTM